MLIDYVLAGANGQRHHRKRRILAALRDKAGSVGHEQILHIPALIELVENTLLWVTAHARRSDFVYAETGSAQSLVTEVHFESCLMRHFIEGLELVAGHRTLVIGVVGGILGAVIGTLGGRTFRARLAAAFGSDRPAAFIEDAVAIGGAVLIMVALP